MAICPCHVKQRVLFLRSAKDVIFPSTIVPFKASELLRVAHDLAKVDVKHVPTVLQHDVVVVTVTDAQDEGGHTPACTGVDEVHHSLQTETLFLV